HALPGENVLCALPREPGTRSPIAAADRRQPAAPQTRLGTLGWVSGRGPLGVDPEYSSYARSPCCSAWRARSADPRAPSAPTPTPPPARPPHATPRDALLHPHPPLERAGKRAASPTLASTHTRRHRVCDQSFRPSAATDSCWMEPGRMLRRHTMHARSTVARL